MGYVEDAFEGRTPHEERRVSARWGRAGEKGGFFSILLGLSLEQIRKMGEGRKGRRSI